MNLFLATDEQPAYLGRDSALHAQVLLKRYNPRHVFLVTGKASYAHCGAEAAFRPLLEEIPHTRFSDFSANPKVEDLERGVAAFKACDPDLVLAIGGGSVIDLAKAVNILAFQTAAATEYILGRQKLTTAGVPLIAVPTTSGTGSEATHFSVAYIGPIKYSLAHPAMRPTVALVDPIFTHTLSASLTATTGIDAFCQAMESLWSVRATPQSQIWAKEALRITHAHLRAAVLAPTNEHRQAMSEAAYLAGKAIDVSKTTASHALSYPFTAHFGVPHGHAAALTLAAVLGYNADVKNTDVNDPRGTSYVQHTLEEIVDLLGASSSGTASQEIETLLRDIGLATRLGDLGVQANDLELVLNEASLERLENNPRQLTRATAHTLLTTLL